MRVQMYPLAWVKALLHNQIGDPRQVAHGQCAGRSRIRSRVEMQVGHHRRPSTRLERGIVESPLQTGKHTGQQMPQPAYHAHPISNQIFAMPGQHRQVANEVGAGIDDRQVQAHSGSLGNDAGVFSVGVALPRRRQRSWPRSSAPTRSAPGVFVSYGRLRSFSAFLSAGATATTTSGSPPSGWSGSGFDTAARRLRARWPRSR